METSTVDVIATAVAPIGYKQSGRGRLRGLAALDDVLEYKHIVLKPGVVARACSLNES